MGGVDSESILGVFGGELVGVWIVGRSWVLGVDVEMDDHFGNGGVIWGSMSAIMIMGNTIAMENGEVERMAL